ncbi:MAG: hypothetical protein CL947_04070 [Epsilonproteobacteria bacterium]|nr:hypothetical protein [Campylobacterota bacterium]|tara:strand:- start:7463 stop:7837 length:375 start_codon:yes stop_codon:yes gene_type:complete
MNRIVNISYFLFYFSFILPTHEQTIEHKINNCVTKHSKNIDNLTLWNVVYNKSKIENMCLEVLDILEQENNSQHLDTVLLNIKKALKERNEKLLLQYLPKLPQETKSLILKKIKDKTIKIYLGL